MLFLRWVYEFNVSAVHNIRDSNIGLFQDSDNVFGVAITNNNVVSVLTVKNKKLFCFVF